MALQEKENKKQKARQQIFATAPLPAERVPVVAVVFDESTDEDARGVIDGLEALGVPVVLANHTKECEHPTKLTRCVSDEKDALAAADIALVFKDDSVSLARKNNCVPVAPYGKEKTRVTYNPVQEKGNGFYFKAENKWEIFAAVIRAMETYQFPYDWENVVKAAKK